MGSELYKPSTLALDPPPGFAVHSLRDILGSQPKDKSYGSNRTSHAPSRSDLPVRDDEAPTKKAVPTFWEPPKRPP